MEPNQSLVSKQQRIYPWVAGLASPALWSSAGNLIGSLLLIVVSWSWLRKETAKKKSSISLNWHLWGLSKTACSRRHPVRGLAVISQRSRQSGIQGGEGRRTPCTVPFPLRGPCSSSCSFLSPRLLCVFLRSLGSSQLGVNRKSVRMHSII